MRTNLLIRGLGAILLMLVGVDHYYEYSVDHYSVLPTIGPLFLLNFVAATAIGVMLLIPLRRLVRRFDVAAVRVLSLSGFGIALSSLVALLVSEHTKLFGFMESNYRPAIIVAIALEASASVTLALLFVLSWWGGRAANGPRVRLADPAPPRPGSA